MAVLPDPVPDCGSCAARDERIAAQDELIGELRDALGGQADQIAVLREQVARLERALNRNSANSSMPPSSDDVPGKKQPAPRGQRGGKRRPGKQPGTPGAHMAWSDAPDKTVPVFPEGNCACGAD
jgi:transposase